MMRLCFIITQFQAEYWVVMIGRILGRIFRKHLALHLIVPLVVGSLFNATWVHFATAHPWRQFRNDLVSPDNLVFALGVALTYLVIMYRQVKKETAMTIRGNDLAVLDEELNKASKYFATGAIGLQEWFDPVSQVFLSSITAHKLDDPNFRDERTLLFVSSGQMKMLDLPVLEGYYAERLVDIHINHRTPLGFLKPEEVRSILNDLQPNTRKTIRAYPRWCKWLPEWILDRTPWIVGPGIRRLDFAFITREDNSKSVLLVRKEGENLRVIRVPSEQIPAYEELVNSIKKRIYKPGTTEIEAAHDFIKYYHPGTPKTAHSTPSTLQSH